MSEDANGIKNEFFRNRTKIFLSIIKPLLSFYQNELNKQDQIDFNDMINLATEFVLDGSVNMKLKYIIVDEYQDMSVSRFNLIKALRDSTNSKTFCVGDDWQSIYRFTGSDVALFTNFSKHFGYTELLNINKTYRNSQELIDIAGNFIMKNHSQLKKDLKSDISVINPLRIMGYQVQFMESFIATLGEIVAHSQKDNADVMIIGRTNFDVEIFDSKETEDKYGFKLIKKGEQKKLIYKEYPNLNMYYLTAHRSKGLEAEYVIIINMENHRLGFPNKISDDPLLRLVLTDQDEFSYAEERRLFYVALTRTQNITFLLAPQTFMSIFVDELIKKQSVPYRIMSNEQDISDIPNCPRCRKGYLILRENAVNGNKFLGCSNYPHCGNTFKNVEILDNNIQCNICGGFMVKRVGSRGEFYGCTNFPDCRNADDIESESDQVVVQSV